MSAVDWDQYRKCPVCFALMGQPCTSLTGVSGRVLVTNEARDRPHSRRKQREGASRG